LNKRFLCTVQNRQEWERGTKKLSHQRNRNTK